MENKLLIDKECIKKFNYATFYFLFSGDYKIDISQIADIYLKANKNNRKNRLEITDGYIELKPGALAVSESDTNICDYEHDEERIERNLLTALQEGADIYKIELSSEKDILTTAVPCTPLRNCYNQIIEYSDCPSAERLNNGNWRIYAGQSSKSGKRQSLIYSEVCSNWKSLMGEKYCPDLLQGEVINIYIDDKEIAIELEIYNRRSPMTHAEFSFTGYKIHSFKLYTQQILADNLIIERMANGNIYVALHECGICLECKEMNIYIPD